MANIITEYIPTDNLNDGYYGSGRRLRYSINKCVKKITLRNWNG